MYILTAKGWVILNVDGPYFYMYVLKNTYVPTYDVKLKNLPTLQTPKSVDLTIKVDKAIFSVIFPHFS